MKKWLSALAIILMLGMGFNKVSAESFHVDSRSAIAIEANTGKILYQQNADKATYIASLTKMLTIYMVYQAIDDGKLSLDSNVKVSDYAYKLTQNPEVSNVDLSKRQYSVSDLINASLVSSANSAAIALAEKVGGSEPKFVDMMRQQVKKWGIKDAQLYNASGLNNSMLDGHIYPKSSKKAENKLSAKDLAIIAQHLIKDYPQVLEVTNQATAEFGTQILYSSNQMLLGMPMARYGVDGLKTGTTELAGQTFVATSLENDMRVITVVLHANQAETDQYARFTETDKLLDYVYNTFEMRTLLHKGQKIGKQIPVQNAKIAETDITAKQELALPVRKKSKEKLGYTLKMTDKHLKAKLNKGKVVGKLTYKDKDLVGDGYLGATPSIQVQIPKTIDFSLWHAIIQSPKNFFINTFQ